MSDSLALTYSLAPSVRRERERSNLPDSPFSVLSRLLQTTRERVKLRESELFLPGALDAGDHGQDRRAVRYGRSIRLGYGRVRWMMDTVG